MPLKRHLTGLEAASRKLPQRPQKPRQRRRQRDCYDNLADFIRKAQKAARSQDVNGCSG